MSGNSQQIIRKSSATNNAAAVDMSGKILTHKEEELEERIYNKIAAKIQDEMNIDSVKLQIKQIDERVEKMELSAIKNTNTKWFCIGSGDPSTSAPSDDDRSIFKLSQDLYAVLATASWRSVPFWLSILVIFGFQYLLAILLLTNQVDINSDNNNPLNIPANVETSVRISQVMLIAIALFSQRDLLAGIESLASGLPDHFYGDSRFVSMTRTQWRLSSVVRLVQGLLNFLASFVLSVRSDTVLDVLLNVLGVAFISDLDELAFRLCTKGYFGGSMKRMSKDVCDVRLHRIVNLRMPIPMDMKRKVKKDAHIISAFAIFFAGLAGFSYLAIRQNTGVYLEQDIRIEFGDEVLPFLGLFNGCYRISESKKGNARRLIYEQVGYPNGGKFGFCSDFGEGDSGWTFFIGEQGDDDICEKKSYILRSGETSTFSLLEAGKTKWYTYNDLPMDYLEITETTACWNSIFELSKDACPSILAFDTMSMTKLSPSANVAARSKWSLDAAFSHPIYFSNSTENGSFALIFFTGRRWIRTKSDYIQGLGNETSLEDIADFFYSNYGLFKLTDQLRTSVDEEAELVSAVSEIVDTVRDQGSPLGLLWYLPRYEEKISNATETETDKLQRSFPSANLARPIDSVWTCLFCNDETNPCLNEGACNPNNGTCVCKHGETGDLCQILPLGNGMCNSHYNKVEYYYDGGDCCGGTCRGKDCGKDDLPDLFSRSSDPHVDEDGWYYPFLNRTEEWEKTFRGREFAYGVEIVSDKSLQIFILSEPPRRFSRCTDTNTALLTIQQKVSLLSSFDGDTLIELAGTTVRCDGTLHLQTPFFRTIDDRPNHIFKEEVRVPYGARCTIGFLVSEGPVEFSIFAETQSVPFLRQGFGQGKEVKSFRIPESKCVWDAFVGYHISPVFTDLEYEEFGGGVDLDSMCAQDQGEVLDRYAFWRIAKSITDGDLSQNFVGHVCDLTWTSSMGLFCSDNRRGSLLSLGNNAFQMPTEIGILTSLERFLLSHNQLAELPSEIGMLRALVYFDLNNNTLAQIPSEIGMLRALENFDLHDNTLTWVPSEIGRLTALKSLDLRNNTLTWIPSEMGRITTLTSLDLRSNTLASIPSEIGSLKRLKQLSLEYNPMTWESLPKEVQDLESEGTYIDICRDYGEDGCLEYLCNDNEWSYGTYSCDTYNSLGYCATDQFLNSGFALTELDDDNTGKNACCICGGGNKTFILS